MKWFLVVIAAVLPFACAHRPPPTVDLVSIVKQKAAFELACDKADLKVAELSSGQAMSNGFAATNQKSYGVEGCGKRASYYAWCTDMMGNQSCEAIQQTAAASPTP